MSTPSQAHSHRRWLCEMFGIMLVFAVISYFVLQQCISMHHFLFADNTRWLLLLALIGGVIPVFYLFFQAVMVFFYKPVTEWPENRPLPGCTIIVPAYNEGPCVAETLRSLLQSDYPHEKMEIIAINDGSADDTWNWIKLAAGESNGMIRAVNLEKNGGKKHALAIGFREAKHEIVVTIDSDSIVEKDTIRNLILPFSTPEVGVSAGMVRVRNMNDGFIPKILDICLVFGCDFVRCAQSVTGIVLCSPGAVSAYRKEALLPCVDEWLNQTFMGKPSLIGEDRALTSLLLLNSWRAVLQNNAVVWSGMPTTYSKLCRTLLRWGRGDIREGLLMIRHFFRRFSITDFRRITLQITLLCQLLNLSLPILLFPCTIAMFLLSHNMVLMLLYTLFISWFWTMVPAVLYAQRESPLKAFWAFFLTIYNLFALIWISPYAWLTVGDSRWMTREITQKEPERKLALSAGRNLP